MRLVPYRVRLWWSNRGIPVCHCTHPQLAPAFHDHECPVYQLWGDED